MKAIILAAGRGSRMAEATDDRPKCLVELNGESLLKKQLAALRAGGVTDIAIVTGYRSDLLQLEGVYQFHNPDWAHTQMVSSLCRASEWLQNEACIVSYSDIFYSAETVSDLLASPGQLAISYDPNWFALWSRRFGDPLLDAETFRLDGESRLLEIGNKPETVEEIQGQYMGLLKFTPAAWERVRKITNQLSPDTFHKLHMTGLLQRVITDGEISVSAVAVKGEWGEVDSQSDLRVYATGETGV